MTSEHVLVIGLHGYRSLLDCHPERSEGPAVLANKKAPFSGASFIAKR